MSDISKKIDNIEKLAKEAERILEDLQSNPFLEFDRIAKDIREREENAIAIELTKCIGELLRKNGVVPKLTEYTRNFETDKTFETRYGVSIDELDFSEHDKVFEDEIRVLKGQVEHYKSAFFRDSEKLSKLNCENKELKQRIAELESKENIIEVKVSASPIEIATHLINNTCTINELKMIAEHINVYCNGGK